MRKFIVRARIAWKWREERQCWARVVWLCLICIWLLWNYNCHCCHSHSRGCH